MFEGLSNDEISIALDELVACLGVKEEMSCQDLLDFLRNGDTERCVKEIAIHFGLPIRICLSFVPKGYSPGNTGGFRSTALSNTDGAGHGIESITAQVSIPEHIPIFGSSSLQGYPIQVRVGENCHEHPDVFIAIMAHELSHVLLACLWSPHKHSELHADLIPIILGFGGVVQRGRKTSSSMTIGNMTTTHTTSYGYLTDAQFGFARNNVAGILKRHMHTKERLLTMTRQVRRKLEQARIGLATFHDYFKHLDKHPPKRMKPGHAQRIVHLHADDDSRHWESRISATDKTQQEAEAFAQSLTHYTSRAVEQLDIQTHAITRAFADLSEVTEAMSKDKNILRKYVGFIYRLRRTFSRH